MISGVGHCIAGQTLQCLAGARRSRPERERRDANHWTQLHLSAGNGHLETVKPLLERWSVLALNDQALRGRNTIRNIAGIWIMRYFEFIPGAWQRQSKVRRNILWLKCDV